ncbi:MAG: hypothetical protein J5I98_15615 [Phaeodactylibacter sp.]|nr:hypothetical protein [Phaeodactylibacter sp.]
MEKSLLYQAARQLGRRDAQQFEKWLRSPFFNQDEAVLRLWAYLAECRWDLGLSPEKEKGFAAAYSGKPFQGQKMRLLMSRLYKQLEQFLAYSELARDKRLHQYHLARAFRRRKLWGHFQRALGQAQQHLDGDSARNAAYYTHRLQLQEEAHHLQSTNDPTEATHLQEMADVTDRAYLIRRLRQSCLLLAHSTVYHPDFDPGPMPALLRFAESRELTGEPAIGLYYYCYRMLLHPESEKGFRAFQSRLFEDGDCVSAVELRDLYLLAINYCVRQVNDGRHSFYRELYMLYQKGLETGSLLENGVLSRFTYHNIVATGLQAGEQEWVEQFIHQFRDALERPYRESSFSFCLARLEYARKRFGEALSLLQKANYRDPLLNLATKTLQLKIYYESGEAGLLAAHLDAMANYIRRKKVIGYHRANYLNITRYAKKMAAANPYDQTEIAQLLEAIRQEEVLTERLWFLEQVQLLMR